MVGKAKLGEREATLGVEPVDRLEQAERGDLLEIVDVRDVVIAASELVGEGKKPLDDRVACRRI